MFGRKTKRVAILGCGPAGMFATHAFAEAGWDVTVYSRKRRSQMFGAQYLHSPIPGLPEHRIEVEYTLRGTAEGYRDKVYGPPLPGREAISVSPDYLLGEHPAWDIRAAYHEAYGQYEVQIIEATVTPEFLDMEFGNPQASKYWSAVISTIPAPQICVKPQEHLFHSQRVWAAGDAPELGRLSPVTAPKSTVICNGLPEIAWYRCANVFGHNTCEWPLDRKPPIEDLAEVFKPIGNDCTCWPEITRLGRYGQWEKGVLTDEVYVRAAKIANKG
jgi:hypothetical protein